MAETHVTEWLGAYYDGELQGSRLAQVEAHLAECEQCRLALEQLAGLSRLLAEAPAAPRTGSPERFAAQIRLQLAPRPVQPTWQRRLELGWRLIPAALVGAWLFAEAVFMVSGLVVLALASGVDGNLQALVMPRTSPLTMLSGWLAASGFPLNDLAYEALETFYHWAGWGATQALRWGSLAVIAALCWSWLAILWARQRHALQAGAEWGEGVEP